MIRISLFLGSWLLAATTGWAAEPIKALMIAGGCCHDYANQKVIISEGISARANVSWTIIHEGDDREHMVSAYQNPDWAKGFDVVLHNECFGHVTDDAFIENIVAAHKAGVAAVMLHCSTHSYRNATTDEWRKLLGVSSVRHGAQHAFQIANVQPEHPVMQGFPDSWQNFPDELYQIIKPWPDMIPLGQGVSEREAEQVCVWVNTYEKAKVFGTTLGHNNTTMQSGVYLDLVTRGLLWACGKLDENGNPQPGYEAKLSAKPISGAEVILDGTRAMLDEKWTYWEGPRFASALPIKWKIVNDPVDGGTCVMTDDAAAAGGRYGAADIVTKKAYRDFRLHVEFLVMKPGGNSGVYLQNRYEIQVLDGDTGAHGMAAIINEAAAPFDAYNGTGRWNTYDLVFRAARFQDGKRVERAIVTLYFNGKKVHTNVGINQVWGGANSGVDGGNDGGRGITDTPQGLKLQAEGHDVRYRNIWIKELDLKEADTDF